MEDEKSEIIDFYPTDFQTDLNGKTQEWESVVLISFIDEKRLRKAMEPKLKLMTNEEQGIGLWRHNDIRFINDLSFYIFVIETSNYFQMELIFDNYDS